MEQIAQDDRTVTIRFDRDEFIGLIELAKGVFQEYESLDPEILNLSREEVGSLKNGLYAILDTNPGRTA